MHFERFATCVFSNQSFLSVCVAFLGASTTHSETTDTTVNANTGTSTTGTSQPEAGSVRFGMHALLLVRFVFEGAGRAGESAPRNIEHLHPSQQRRRNRNISVVLHHVFERAG